MFIIWSDWYSIFKSGQVCLYTMCPFALSCLCMQEHEKIRWTRAKRHTADSCFELVGSHQRSPAQFTRDIPKVFLSSCGSELMRFIAITSKESPWALPPQNSSANSMSFAILTLTLHIHVHVHCMSTGILAFPWLKSLHMSPPYTSLLELHGQGTVSHSTVVLCI